MGVGGLYVGGCICAVFSPALGRLCMWTVNVACALFLWTVNVACALFLWAVNVACALFLTGFQ